MSAHEYVKDGNLDALTEHLHNSPNDINSFDKVSN